jgi:hypothetical protein
MVVKECPRNESSPDRWTGVNWRDVKEEEKNLVNILLDVLTYRDTVSHVINCLAFLKAK